MVDNKNGLGNGSLWVVSDVSITPCHLTMSEKKLPLALLLIGDSKAIHPPLSRKKKKGKIILIKKKKKTTHTNVCMKTHIIQRMHSFWSVLERLALPSELNWSVVSIWVKYVFVVLLKVCLEHRVLSKLN